MDKKASEQWSDETRGYREALGRIKSELGVPGAETPAPVANAVAIADAALQGRRHEFPDGPVAG